MTGNMIRGLLLGLVLSVPSWAQVTLEQKFREGDTYAAEITAEITQKLTLNGTEVDTSNSTVSLSRFTVGKRDIEQKLPVAEKTEGFKTSVSAMGQVYEFDSAKPDDKGSSPLELLRPLHKALMNRTTTIIYDKDNKAVEAKMDQDLIGSLPPDVEPLVKSQLDPKTLIAEANDSLDQIKSDPIKPGDTWRRNKGQNLGAGQVMGMETEYTYVGTEKKDGRELDKITSKVTALDFSFQNSPLPIQLKNSTLKPEETSGTLWFDRQLGRVVASESKIRITGEITFSANGTDLPAKLDLTMKTSTTQKP